MLRSGERRRHPGVLSFENPLCIKVVSEPLRGILGMEGRLGGVRGGEGGPDVLKVGG